MATNDTTGSVIRPGDLTPASSSTSTPTLEPESNDVDDRPTVPQYQYCRLPSGKYTRLLKLLPNLQHDAGVVCNLRTWDLDSQDCPTYTAISYTWGTGEANASISIVNNGERNGKLSDKVELLAVRENVVDILQHLRQTNTTRWLWIDALCIDQSSTEERNHQVQLMGRIYREANRVIAWLGTGGPDKKCQKSIQAAFETLEHWWPEFQFHLRLHFKKHKTHGFNFFAEFCMLRYWTRKWIIQEIIEAKSVVLQDGHRTMSIIVLEKFFQQLNTRYPLILDDPQSLAGSWYEQPERYLMATPAARIALHRLSRHKEDKKVTSLHKLLTRYKDHQCAEPWDHVYALYNMVGDHSAHLQINYTQSVRDLYRSTISFMRDYDEVPEQEWASTTSLLMRLLSRDMDDVLDIIPKHAGLIEPHNVVVTLRRFSSLQHADESKDSESLRLTYCSLNHMAKWSLAMGPSSLYTTKSGGTWKLMPHEEVVGPQDFTHFRVGSTDLIGFSSCRIQSSYELWQVDGSKLDFIARTLSGGDVEIVGRAFTCTQPGSEEVLAAHSSVRISLTTDESIILGFWADGLDLGKD